PFFWCTNCFYKTPEIRHFIFLYPCTKKRWFFGAWGVVCGIGAANAELPENVKFCIPKQYRVTYDCPAGGNAPEPVKIVYGQMYTTPGNDACGGNVGGWRVDGTDTIITPNTTLPYTYVHDVRLLPNLVCPAGTYRVNYSCEKCGKESYCPGDNAQYECPQNTLTADQLLARENATSFGSVTIASTFHVTPQASPTDCYMRLLGLVVPNGTIGQITYGYNPDNEIYDIKTTLVYWSAAGVGYYLVNQYAYNSFYKSVRQCTNAPANAHYTGPGTPDVGNCPWECDSGFTLNENTCIAA
ncbi:MAG: hypothetical protein IJ560_00235, partial [Alphaproteobacteria bacterium]|nr:hypothetical protein [Alphaproteobacteria bacterium]